MSDFLKDIIKETGNEYATLASEGVDAGDVSNFVDTGCYSLNALLSGSIYGGMPARLSLQNTYFETIQDAEWTRGRGAEINWDLVVACMAYPDNPNHESGLPNSLESQDRYNAFTQELDSDPALDLTAAVDALLADLQTIYDQAGE